MKKKILLIAYAFPPYAAPESYLCSKLIGNLEGFEKDVLTLDYPITGVNDLDPSLNEYIKIKFNNIFRIKVPKIINLLSFLRIKNLFRFPDYFVLANSSLLKFINKNINLGDYSHVITWSQFHSVHLIGLELKKKKNLIGLHISAILGPIIRFKNLF